MTAPTDGELVEAYLDNNQDGAFFQLIRRYQIPVFRQLSFDLADPDDAEQVCETVFVVAGRRLAEWSGDEDFKNWLMGVAGEVIQSRRGVAVQKDSPRLVDPAAYFRHSVHRALGQLMVDDRSLLVAVDLQGRSPEEVAAEANVPVGEISQSLTRARRQFTETLARPAELNDVQTHHRKMAVRSGEVIDNRYRLEEVLGEGGMARVFAAEHLGIKRRVAVKTLRPTRQGEAMIRERFVREAEVLGRLAHPNFVDVSDFGESSAGFAYLVMELLEGGSLSAVLEEQGKMAPSRALQIVRQICLGLEFAHKNGVVHRDIKPDNIVVLDEQTDEGFAKILDLGIAATDEEEDDEEPVLYGTPAYMAPEQVQGVSIDGRVDLYALGVVLFELLTGELPFRASSAQFLLVLHLSQPPPTLQSVLGKTFPGIEALQRILDRCLAKRPGDRFPNATAMRTEVEELLTRLDDKEPLARRRKSAPATSAEGESSAWTLRRWISLCGLILFCFSLVAIWYFSVR